MKIHVDKKNNRVIATGYYSGKKIRSIAHCREPVFDEDFGIELAKKKYSIKLVEAKKRLHERTVSELHRTILWCFHVMDYEQLIVANYNKKLKDKSSECAEFINNYFNEGE